MILQGFGPARRARFLTAWALAIAFGIAVFGTAEQAWYALPHPAPLEELSYYPSGHLLQPMTLGHAAAAADFAWMRAVQYYGEHRQTDGRYTRMRHVFRILTSLAPDFVPAYVFGGFALAQEGRDVEGGEQLLLQGLEANPTSGPLAFELGFFYFVRPGGRDLTRAAQYFEQAARQPDGPPQAARFAAFAHQNSGNLMVAYALWAEVLRRSPNPYMRDMAERQMAEIRQAIAEGRPDRVIHHLGVPEVRLTPAR